MQLHAAQTQINGLDKRIIQAHRVNANSKRLNAIPGFGVILSTAVVATMTEPKAALRYRAQRRSHVRTDATQEICLAPTLTRIMVWAVNVE